MPVAQTGRFSFLLLNTVQTGPGKSFVLQFDDIGQPLVANLPVKVFCICEGSGIVTATIQFETSFDGIGWNHWGKRIEIVGSAPATAKRDGDMRCTFVRANLLSLTGIKAKCRVTLR